MNSRTAVFVRSGWRWMRQRVWGFCEESWLSEHPMIRWGLPLTVGVGVWMLGMVWISSAPSPSSLQTQLHALQQNNALKRRQWQQDEPVRQREQALVEAVRTWQSGMRWGDAAPWLQWPQLAQSLGVDLHKVEARTFQTFDHHEHQTVVLEGRGRLSDIDAVWREWGRRGWWVTSLSMRVALTPDGSLNWQANWALNQTLPMGKPQQALAPGQAHFIKAQWAQRWLSKGGPTIAQFHDDVPVVTPLTMDDRWTLASLSQPLRSDVAVPTPWPHTPWEQMRLVGHWMRGQHVVALVAVDDVVHAVVPGMRLGPQRHEVVQVTNEGVWVAPATSGGPARRVLHWVDRPVGAGS